MSQRTVIAASVALLLVSFMVPAAAQQAPEPGFLPGKWDGTVLVSGWYSSDTVRQDGSFDTSVTDVIGDTDITFNLTVAPDGTLSGTMNVRLIWFKESVGTQPTSFDTYHVESYHEQTGSLVVSGTASQLNATGILSYYTAVEAEGREVPEVSGTEDVEVEWVFSAFSANCALVQGGLESATGNSIMQTVALDRDIDDASEIHNRLSAGFGAWPANVDDPVDVSKELEAVRQAADDLLERGDLPYGEHLLDLIEAWVALEQALAGLDTCQQQQLSPEMEFEAKWLIFELQRALETALENVESYEVIELIELFDAGWQGSALNGELVVGYIDAINDGLDDAITAGDKDSIHVVLLWAATYGYPNTYDKAYNAYYGSQAP